MSTSQTSLLKLALPTTGELSGTWGDTVNNSITSLVDSAVAGTTVLASDSDVVLSDTALVANQSRQAIILWTASNTVTRYITAPARSKAYVFINGGTGSVVLRGSGPTTGVTLSPGQGCVAAWNGTDFVNVSAANTVTGPVSSTNNNVALFDGTTGKIIKDAGKGLPAGTVVGTTDTQTLTNKTISVDSNTVSGVAASSFVLSNSSGNLDGSAAQKAIPTGDVVGTTDTQTLTNKTLTSPAVSDPTATGAIYDNGSVRGNVTAVAALDINCSLGNYFTKTISTNSTFTFSNAPASRSYSFTLELTLSGGTITWPAAVTWPSNIAPTLPTGKTHLLIFVTDDGGSRWRGASLIGYNT